MTSSVFDPIPPKRPTAANLKAAAGLAACAVKYQNMPNGYPQRLSCSGAEINQDLASCDKVLRQLEGDTSATPGEQAIAACARSAAGHLSKQTLSLLQQAALFAVACGVHAPTPVAVALGQFGVAANTCNMVATEDMRSFHSHVLQSILPHVQKQPAQPMIEAALRIDDMIPAGPFTTDGMAICATRWALIYLSRGPTDESADELLARYGEEISNFGDASHTAEQYERHNGSVVLQTIADHTEDAEVSSIARRELEWKAPEPTESPRPWPRWKRWIGLKPPPGPPPPKSPGPRAAFKEMQTHFTMLRKKAWEERTLKGLETIAKAPAPTGDAVKVDDRTVTVGSVVLPRNVPPRS